MSLLRALAQAPPEAGRPFAGEVVPAARQMPNVYDSYHKESMSAVDKRSGLEIRVVKEQLQSLGGQLRWVSSERQFSDGLTKMSTRQSLADRLRHAKVKFPYDPACTAAKKKPLSERQAEIQ